MEWILAIYLESTEPVVVKKFETEAECVDAGERFSEHQKRLGKNTNVICTEREKS